ncbi:MAG: hypothetical protein DDT33_01808 [Firmicutes bacterium]|nr:hypothetical protein [Bacillota bacterium]
MAEVFIPPEFEKKSLEHLSFFHLGIEDLQTLKVGKHCPSDPFMVSVVDSLLSVFGVIEVSLQRFSFEEKLRNAPKAEGIIHPPSRYPFLLGYLLPAADIPA